MAEKKRWVQYTPEEREASNKCSQLKQRSKAKGLKLLWKREDFISWYKKVSKRCYYCGCTLNDIRRFWELNDSKRKVTRGRSFEIDRLRMKATQKTIVYWLVIGVTMQNQMFSHQMSLSQSARQLEK